MIKAVFFDLDGTLCDSDTAWSIAQREIFQLLHEHYPDVSEETLTEAWRTVHQELFKQLNAGKCAMADVRDSRFQCLFRELGLPVDKVMEELSDFFCLRYLTSLRLYDDVAILEKLQTYHVGIITNGAHDEHTIGVNLVIFRCVLKSSKGRIFSTAFLQSVCVLKCAFYVFQGFNDCLC